MASTINIPLTTLQPGLREFGPVSVNNQLVSAVLAVDRTVVGGFDGQPDTTQCEIEVWQSNDGGTSWVLLVGGGMRGGHLTDKNGATIQQSSVTANLFPGTSRQVKAALTVAGAPVAVSGTLTIT